MGEGEAQDVVEDDEVLWRVFTEHHMAEEEGGGRRVSSLVFFQRGSDGISAYRADKTTKEWVYSRHPDALGILKYTASDVRSVGAEVVPDPLPDDPSHTLMNPCADKKLAKRLMKAIKSKNDPPEMAPPGLD